MTKKLYVVSVSFEFPVMAESEEDALDHVDEAVEDAVRQDTLCAYARKTYFNVKGEPRLPVGFVLTDLVYGTEKDTTLEEAIELERINAHNDKVMANQMRLPLTDS